jgi:hypothetical protein
MAKVDEKVPHPWSRHYALKLNVASRSTEFNQKPEYGHADTEKHICREAGCEALCINISRACKAAIQFNIRISGSRIRVQ